MIPTASRAPADPDKPVKRDLTRLSDLFGFADPQADLKEPTYERIEIPEDFGPTDVLVDLHKVRRFAFAVDAVLPQPVRIAPAGLLSNDLLQMFTLRYAASRVVGLHTEEELWFDRPVPLGGEVTLTARYTEKYLRRGQGHVVMLAEARNREGQTLLRHRGVEIMRTAPAEIAGRGSARETKRRVAAEWDPSLPLVERIGPGTPPGSGLLPMAREATLEQMALFSRLGEGVTNIHNDIRTARRAGLDLPIMQGQQLVAHLSQLVDARLGPGFQHGGHLHVKFLKPVMATETFTVEGAVQAIGGDVDPRAELEVWIRRHDGGLAAVGWADGALR
jgi:acyl dehydratase